MKEKIILFFKGMILGAAMIIPGVSGGTLAISMGLYEKIILTVSHFFKDFKKNILFCLNLGLGILASLILCSLVLNYTLEHAPIPTILFFVGLIVGSIPMISKKAKINTNFKVKYLLFALIGIALVFGLSFMKGSTMVDLTNLNLLQVIKLIIVGFLAAATLIIPGISGSFLLMVLGYYHPILSTITNIIKFDNIGNNLLVLIPFGLGVMLGVIIIVKIIEYLLKNYKIQTYYAILGFLIASIAEVFISLFDYTTSILQIIIGIALFILGSFLSLKVFKND